MKLYLSIFILLFLSLPFKSVAQTVDSQFFSEVVEIRDNRLGLLVSENNEHLLYVENSYNKNGTCAPAQKKSGSQDENYQKEVEDYQKRKKSWDDEYAKVHPKIEAEWRPLLAERQAKHQKEMMKKIQDATNASPEEKQALLAEIADPNAVSNMMLDTFNEVKAKHAGFLGPYPEPPEAKANFSHINAILLIKNRDLNASLLTSDPPNANADMNSSNSTKYKLADTEIKKFQSTHIAALEKACPGLESIIFKVGFYDLVYINQKLRSKDTDKITRIIWKGDGNHKNIDRKWQYNLYDSKSAYYYMSAQVPFSKTKGVWGVKQHGIQGENYPGAEYYIVGYITLAEVIKDWGNEPPFIDYSPYELSLMSPDGKSIRVPNTTNSPTNAEIRLAILREHQSKGAEVNMLTGEIRNSYFGGSVISILESIDDSNCQSSGNIHRCNFNSVARTYFGEGGIAQIIGDVMASQGSKFDIVKGSFTHDFELTTDGWRSKSMNQNIEQRAQEFRQSAREGVAEGLKAGACAAAQLGPDMLIPSNCR